MELTNTRLQLTIEQTKSLIDKGIPAERATGPDGVFTMADLFNLLVPAVKLRGSYYRFNLGFIDGKWQAEYCSESGRCPYHWVTARSHTPLTALYGLVATCTKYHKYCLNLEVPVIEVNTRALFANTVTEILNGTGELNFFKEASDSGLVTMSGSVYKVCIPFDKLDVFNNDKTRRSIVMFKDGVVMTPFTNYEDI